MQDLLFKLSIFGDGGVGKTTLVNRYLTGVFNEGTLMTIGVDFHIKRVEVDGKKIILQIWDFAGENHFRFLLPTYVRGAAGGVFMYDITREASLRNLSEWIKVFNNGANNIAEKKIPLIMVGGKLDLRYKRAIPREIAIEIAKENDFYAFIECSAKTGSNVEAIFETAARAMMRSSNLLSKNVI